MIVSDARSPGGGLDADDVELLAALARREPTAPRRAFRRYAPAVEARLRGGLGYQRGGRDDTFAGLRSAFDVDDAVLEVFARALAEVGRWSSGGPQAHLDWLAREVMLEGLRARTPDRLELTDDALPTPAAVGASGARFADAVFGRSLHTFRRQLRPQQRQVLELRFEQERTLIDVGARTGLMPASLQEVEQQVRAALIYHLARHGELSAPSPHRLARWLPGVGRCRWNDEVIEELAGELAGARRVMLRRHARGCAECRATWDRAGEAELRWLRVTRLDRLWSALAAVLG